MLRYIYKNKFLIVAIFIILVLSVSAISAYQSKGREIEAMGELTEKKDFIKYVEFNVPYNALEKAYKLDVNSHDKDIKLSWIEILACLAAKNGGDFSSYKDKDMDEVSKELLGGKSIEDLTKKLKHYPYYYKAYSTILGEFLGTYSIQVSSQEDTDQLIFEEKYGLKVFSPIAKTFPFDHYADFGSKRTYGYSRPHLGHDLMASTGTPVIAIESGIVEIMGWNQYGGWRIGIRSLDKKRYYYYAHLRKDKPYHVDLYENKVVKAGDVIGYIGRTGYSPHENVNNITQSHLHLGLELVFDESQKESNNEIWINLYSITKFLQKNQSEVYRNPENKHYYRKYDFKEPLLTQ